MHSVPISSLLKHILYIFSLSYCLHRLPYYTGGNFTRNKFKRWRNLAKLHKPKFVSSLNRTVSAQAFSERHDRIKISKELASNKRNWIRQKFAKIIFLYVVREGGQFPSRVAIATVGLISGS